MAQAVNPLGAIGWPYPDGPATDPQWATLLAAHPQARPARVAEQHRSGYLVAEGPDAAYPAESPPEWQRPPGYRQGRIAPDARATVGDWVLVAGAPPHARIVALLPRHSAIKRGAAGEHYRQQLIAANVDTVFVVCGLDADFNPRRIERYLLLVQAGGAGAAAPGAVVVLTKADKATAADPDAVAAARAALAGTVAPGVAVVALNAKDRDALAVLAPWLQPGRSIVLVGSSGAGKSTLTNTLLGIDRMKTGAVRAGDARGRHTTTHRALVPLPSGACLIDTPGMRELKPTGEEDVAGSFAEIEALAAQCRFRDCRHQREPGCAVQAAVAAGTLDAGRLAHYAKLRGEVAGAADRLAGRLAQRGEAKPPTRSPAKPPARTPSKTPGEPPDGNHGRR
ncbi:ribosome small subunit-dependent GTPase A [Cognatiluteimonas weifangensis]|uniref:Small ribosomal subunit biogenesis GTPase RsgA n=1 Tax=Cognatiluteimonas weifangensis TaxID=2303539 RepID=A0A372DR30_9GAMM|nr:ribosome small subunit-dependent GTPase A [Luteimonas weifangensis]RFP61827.1 ribosome small subunit-dependent GTPase A [Luteimonas weifangensis]